MKMTKTDYTYIFCGPSGAGKSTILKDIKEEWFPEDVDVLDVADNVLNYLQDGDEQADAIDYSYNTLIKEIYQIQPTFIEVANDSPNRRLPSVIGAGGHGGGMWSSSMWMLGKTPAIKEMLLVSE